MNRVKWKGPYVQTDLLKKIKKTEQLSKSTVKTVPKNSTILPKFVGFTLKVYNGKTFIFIKIVEEMIGYKLGEFILTRRPFSYKNK